MAKTHKKTASNNSDDSTPIGVRLPPALLVKIDLYLERMRSLHPHIKVSRADAIRAMLYEAVVHAAIAADTAP